QTHQPCWKRAKVLDFPGAAIFEPHSRSWYQHSLIRSWSNVHFRVTKSVIRAACAVTQFAKTQVALPENYQLRTVSGWCANDRIGGHAYACTDLDSSRFHFRQHFHQFVLTAGLHRSIKLVDFFGTR